MPCLQRLEFGSKLDQLDDNYDLLDQMVPHNDHHDNEKDTTGENDCSLMEMMLMTMLISDHPGHCKGQCDNVASGSREQETGHKAADR